MCYSRWQCGGLTAFPVSAAGTTAKVFILAGQSNMVGHGKTRDGLNPKYDRGQPQSKANRREIRGGIGGLAWAVKTTPETFGPQGMVGGDGNWLVRDDASVYSRSEVFKDKKKTRTANGAANPEGAATVGFGKGCWNGPENGFGHVVGNALEQDVLIIKVATGGTSLQSAWRSPTAAARRGEFGTDLPFVIANTGIGGSEVKGVGLDLINAQGAVADYDKHPGHKGNVAVVAKSRLRGDRLDRGELEQTQDNQQQYRNRAGK